MIRLACAQPMHRPAVAVPVVTAAAVLGVLAEPSVLFAMSCLLYAAAAVQHTGTRPGDLLTLSYLGWPGRSILALVLTEALLYGGAAGLCAVTLAVLVALVTPVTTGAVAAGCVAVLLPVAAGAVRAARLPSVVRAAPGVPGPSGVSAAPDVPRFGARSQEAR